MTDALFSAWECSQITGQTDIWDALDTTETATPAVTTEDTPEPADGALFPVRVTDEPTGDGALFGLGV